MSILKFSEVKKRFLLIALAGSVVFLYLLYFDSRWCSHEYTGKCLIYKKTFTATLIFPLLLLYSLLGFFFKNEIFSHWVRFLSWYIPLGILCILYAPLQSGRFWMIDSYDIAATVMFISFFASIFVIVQKIIRLRAQENRPVLALMIFQLLFPVAIFFLWLAATIISSFNFSIM